MARKARRPIFVAFHAKGAPTAVDGRVQMDIAAQLQTIDRGFRIIASYFCAILS